MFENILKLARPSVEAKHQHFVVSANKLADTTLFCDVSRLEQVVMNIIGNAVKFTAEGGTIEVWVEQIADTPDMTTDRILIRDNGIGMSREFLPNIFDAFTQAEDSKANARQGTGLGMAITKQLVELMHGTIRVESEPGKGSYFTIELPLCKATKAQIAARQESTAQQADDGVLKGRHILLCEDHPLNREVATRLLKSRGMCIDSAENGRIGVERFAASPLHHYAAVLMDVQMPVMDGLDAARAIRSLPRADAATVPIIAMTGNSFDEDVAKTLHAGMNVHLNKPIDPVKLFATLRDQLNAAHDDGRKRVLIVDDVEVNRAVTRAALAAEFDVIEASHRLEALAALQKEPKIVAVITDVMMPHMDGFALIRNIRADHAYDHIAVLANTQYDEIATEQELNALGADAIFYKPNTPEDINKRLYCALRDKQ